MKKLKFCCFETGQYHFFESQEDSDDYYKLMLGAGFVKINSYSLSCYVTSSDVVFTLDSFYLKKDDTYICEIWNIYECIFSFFVKGEKNYFRLFREMVSLAKELCEIEVMMCRLTLREDGK